MNLFLEGIYGSGEASQHNAVFLAVAHDALLEVTKRVIIVGV